MHPSVKAGPASLEITENRVFGLGNEALARRFARRVLAFDEVRSLALDPASGKAVLSYQVSDGDPGRLLTRLADAVAAREAARPEVDLPQWPDSELITFYRHGSLVSIFDNLAVADGSLTVRHPAIARDRTTAQRTESALRSVPGVIEATATTRLRVRFDPGAVSLERLVRVCEAAVFGRHGESAVSNTTQVDLAFANVSVGTAAVSDLMLSPAMPVAAGLLVYSNFSAFRGAAEQLRRGEIGLPVLYTSIVGVTLASGQFLSAALMLWFLRYWERRYRRDLDAESRALIDQDLALPEEARIVTADGLERRAPVHELVVGQRVRSATGEVVPVDAVVYSGAALVDETALGGAVSPIRKTAGDTIVAASKLLAGALDLDVIRTAPQTRGARIARALTATAMPAAGEWALNQQAETFAGRAVAPTLLTAGAGLVLADLATAGAVLRPDYATGISLSAPLVSWRNLRFALRHGAVINTADAFDRLAKSSWVVIDDHAALREPGTDLVALRAKRLDQTKLLPAMAAAGAWLGDERGAALVRACRAEGFVVRRADLRVIDGDGVSVQFGPHLIRLRGRPVVAGITPPPLFIDVDGVEVGAVRFARNGRPAAAATVSQLRRQGLSVLLLSQRSASGLAHALSVDRYAGCVSAAEKLSLLRKLQQQGIRAAYVGEEACEASLKRVAHLSIGLAQAEGPEDEWEAPSADISLLAPSVTALPALFALARDHAQRKQRVRNAVMAPNLLCVAGAFAFGFTPMAAVFVSNFGTSLAYQNAKRALNVKLPVQFADDEPGSARPLPEPEPIEIRTAA